MMAMIIITKGSNKTGYPFDIYKEFISMDNFNQPELNLATAGDSSLNNLCKVIKTSHNIYFDQHDRFLDFPNKSNKSKKTRSKIIALNVMGKPQKVLFKRNLISAVTNDYGHTLLQLINQKQPIHLRDSVDEVNNLLRR